MKIQVAEHYGLCFGVRDAIAQAEQLANQGPLTILGELVHNPVVRERLAQRGIREGALADRESAETRQVMITAHGASDAARTDWREAGFNLADGTCPLVRQAHEKLRALVAEGFAPVVIGKRGHVEVEGSHRRLSRAPASWNRRAISAICPRAVALGMISQTTQPLLQGARAGHAAIRAARPD